MATSKPRVKGKDDRPRIGTSHGARKPAKAGARPGARPSPDGARSKRPAPGSSGPKPKKAARPKQSRPIEPIRRIASASPSSSKPRRMTEIRSEPSEASRTLALHIASAALDKKAVNVQILDVVGKVDYADFLVLMSGRSERHVLAVADGIEELLSQQTPKRKPTAVEGRTNGSWVVLDYGDVVAHVFQEEARSFYDLDSLWQDARRIPLGTNPPV